jgi:hypothetical protein
MGINRFEYYVEEDLELLFIDLVISEIECK